MSANQKMKCEWIRSERFNFGLNLYYVCSAWCNRILTAIPDHCSPQCMFNPSQRVSDHVAKLRLWPLLISNLSPQAGSLKLDNRQQWAQPTSPFLLPICHATAILPTLLSWGSFLTLFSFMSTIHLLVPRPIYLSPYLLYPFSSSQMCPWLDNRHSTGPPEMTKVRVCWGQRFADPSGNILKTVDDLKLAETRQEGKEFDHGTFSCDMLLFSQHLCLLMKMMSQSLVNNFFFPSGQI